MEMLVEDEFDYRYGLTVRPFDFQGERLQPQRRRLRGWERR